jgi:DNA-binding SARP family transcriptional activator
MPQLSIALLGVFQATLDGQPITSFAYDKVRALLAYLVMHEDQPHQRDTLAALLWPDQPDGTARKQLRNALTTLRAAIGDAEANPSFLLINRNTLQFNQASDYRLDVTDFATALWQSSAHHHPGERPCDVCVKQLTQAAKLYRGPFLDQLMVRDSVAWDEWLYLTREQFHRQALDLLTRLMHYHEQCGNNELARHFAWHALALEAWNEAAHRCLMQVFARSGQRTAALQQYERCQAILAEELGVEPSEATLLLYHSIRTGAVAVDETVTADAHAKPMLFATSPTPTGRVEIQVVGNSILHPLPAGDRNRQRMLERVKRFWITGVLEQSVDHAAIGLGLEHSPGLVEQPWELLVQEPVAVSRRLPPGTSIAGVYDELGGELLILGAPGAGKTMLLLQLARVLIRRAEETSTLPMPIIFTLSSWETQRRSIAEWLVEELSARYQVPRAIGQHWVETQQVLPLLDGLDEVAAEHRLACVEAINRFREQFWLLDMVVCSRTTDYTALASRLRLNGAVVVQPLTVEQVQVYLTRVGESLVPLRRLLDEDPLLREMINTPLMLSIAMLAYQNAPVEVLRERHTLKQRRQHLFDTYVQRMLTQRSAQAPYTSGQTQHWLGWLAHAMVHRSQTLFFLERLQPDYLSEQQQRWYAVAVVVISGLVAGFVSGVANGLSLGIVGVLGGVLLGGGYGLLGGIATGALAGLLGGLAEWLLQRRQPRSKQVGLWPTTRRVFPFGLAIALAIGAPVAVGWSLLEGVVFGTVTGVLFALTLALTKQLDQVTVVESLHWSWWRAARGLFFGGGLGIAVGAVFGVLFGAEVGWGMGWVMGLAMLFIWAFTGSTIEVKTVPNQGIWQTAHNAARVAGSIGLLTGIIFGMITGIANDATYGTGYGIAVGLTTAMMTGLIFGGLACIRHGVVRWLLARIGYAPLDYIPFLDCTARCLLLRKVGGGYMFIHRLLLEHFAREYGAIHDIRSATIVE